MTGQRLRKLTLVAASGDAGRRLDLFIAARLALVSRKAVKRALDGGRVFVNGQVERRANRTLHGDETILLSIEGEAPVVTLPELSVIYRDADLLAVDKPVGMPCHPTVPGRANALDLVRKLLEKEGEGRAPVLLHRLDVNTTGVLLFALSATANRDLAWQFAERQIRKSYLALVTGHPPEEFFVKNFLKAGVHGRTVAVKTGGQPAETLFHALAYGHDLALVEAVPKTGRTHQIRAHLAGAGHPLLGDVLYGGPVVASIKDHRIHLRRHLLHARSLEFTHPVTQQPLTIHAPLPDDFMELWSGLVSPPDY